MNEYKAIGRRYFEYELLVEATNADEAYNYALETPPSKWTQLQGDNVVEIYAIEDPNGEAVFDE
jgi:hypothetical protein